MTFLTGDPPTPPNPIQSAQAQTASNVSTAIASTWLNNLNQVTPTGNLTYDQTGTFSYTDPTTGATYNIPRLTATQTLSPAETNIANRNAIARNNLAGLAATQSGNLSDLLSRPIDTGAAPAAGDPNALAGFNPTMSYANTGGQQGTFGPAGDIRGTYGPADNFSADRSRVEAALYGRLNPQLALERQHLAQTLADQGIRYGSPAYTAAMDNYNRQANDARLAVTQQGGAEQQRLAQMAQAQAQFQNQAQAQQYQEAQGRGTFANTAQQAAAAQAALRGQFQNSAIQQAFAQRQALVNAQNAARGQALSEAYTQRQEPINEITALLSGGQVSRPTFGQTSQTNIPTTDIASLINQNFAQNFQNFQQQSNATNQLLGGILGFAGNVARGPTLSDRRLKENIRRMGTVFAADPEGDRHELPIYQYSFKADPAARRHVGPMAQDVEQIDPAAVGEIGGIKHLDKRRVMGSILRAA